MPLQLKELWDLQQLDSEIDRLKRERSRLDDGTTLRRAFEEAAAVFSDLEARLHKLHADMVDAELELKKIEAKKADFERRLYEGKTTNPKELSAMEREIEMLGRQRGRLDERVLTLMDGIETTTAELATAKARRDQAENRWQEQDAAFRRESTRLDTELASLKPRREAAAKVLEPPTLARYENLRTRHANIAVARFVDDTCGGCHMRLASMFARKLHDSQTYTYCENCMRFLIPGE
jgi:predicted  nucleic acid-binding Zn-ribbon protein